jgi:hypothetical protein
MIQMSSAPIVSLIFHMQTQKYLHPNTYICIYKSVFFCKNSHICSLYITDLKIYFPEKISQEAFYIQKETEKMCRI